MSEWKPIEDAPLKTELLVGCYANNEWRCCQAGLYFDPGNDHVGEPSYWFWDSHGDNSGVTDDEGPTHWMHLPEPPPKDSGDPS